MTYALEGIADFVRGDRAQIKNVTRIDHHAAKATDDENEQNEVISIFTLQMFAAKNCSSQSEVVRRQDKVVGWAGLRAGGVIRMHQHCQKSIPFHSPRSGRKSCSPMTPCNEKEARKRSPLSRSKCLPQDFQISSDLRASPHLKPSCGAAFAWHCQKTLHPPEENTAKEPAA